MQQLILNGILAGVGAVLGFLPQLMVLFLCLALLEDCGYMSRIAFVMDRIFRKFGLSGKSFIPMLIATGCGVPGVMASRTIENEKDRRMTAMLTTFMPCSAKLPIIALIAGAFFPNSSWVAPSAYFVGMGAIVLSGIALKKTKLFSGDPAPFIMELPLYHMPRIGNTLRYTYDHSKAFVKRAGTIIFVSSIVIWFISSYNFSLQSVNENDSILAALGGVIAPLFAPLGWGDWRGAVAAITGLVAKENVIGTFGILYRHAEVAENGVEIWKSLQGAYTPVAGYSFLVFNLLCAPCFAAIGAIHREMGDIKWTWRAIGYQCGLAYAVSFIVYQFGHVIFENGEIGIGLILAAIVLLGMIYFVVRKPIKKTPTVTIEEIKEVKEWQL
jgi:ferrous iron transport protein B